MKIKTGEEMTRRFTEEGEKKGLVGIHLWSYVEAKIFCETMPEEAWYELKKAKIVAPKQKFEK